MTDERLLVTAGVAWLAVSVVATLWSRPGEALAFASFLVAVGVAVALTWQYTDPSA